jgi:hypothetical protein
MREATARRPVAEVLVVVVLLRLEDEVWREETRIWVVKIDVGVIELEGAEVMVKV